MQSNCSMNESSTNDEHIRGDVVKKRTVGMVLMYALTICLMICITYLLTALLQEKQSKISTEEMICIPSSIFGPSSTDRFEQSIQGIIVVHEDTGIVYCGTISQMVKWANRLLINEIFNDAQHPELPLVFTEGEPKSCPENSRTLLIKLTTIDMVKTKEHPTGVESKIHWKQTTPSHGIWYSENNASLVIEQPGLYRVSTHLKLNTSQDSTIVKLSLHLNTNGNDKVIMENSEEACETGIGLDASKKMASQSTSSTSSVFELGPRDQIYLTISHPQNIIDHSSVDHFFIVYKMNLS